MRLAAYCGLILTCGAAISAPAGAQQELIYATVGGRALAVDLYLPEGAAKPPLVIWVHGGAWRSGSREDPPSLFVANGFALASVDYRLSGDAPFPAAVHDIKAAIRYLRSRADELGFDGERIAIAGESAGGHLAALVGLSGGAAELEGRVGDADGASSGVQAILVYFGASDLTTILSQSTPFGLEVRVPALEQFLGAHPDSVPAVARLASPVYHVDARDPPLLLLHGDRDPQMPINQSHQLVGAYRAAGLPAELRVVHGAAHGGGAFYSPEESAAAIAFLRAALGRVR